MQEIFQEYQRPKVERSANKAKRDGDVSRWVFEEVEEFHCVYCGVCVVVNVPVFTGDVLSGTLGFRVGQQLFSRIFSMVIRR